MSRFRRNTSVHFFVPYYGYYRYKLLGVICGLVLMFVVLPAMLYFPVIKLNIEHQKSIVERIEQDDADFVYDDVSEFSTHKNAYSQGHKYDGKIVKFRGRIGIIGGASSDIQGDSMVSVNSLTFPDKWCADCGINDKSEEDLEINFTDGDDVVITGEVYYSSWVIALRNCKIEHLES